MICSIKYIRLGKCIINRPELFTTISYDEMPCYALVESSVTPRIFHSPPFHKSPALVLAPHLGFTRNEFKESLCYKGVGAKNFGGLKWHKDNYFKNNYMIRAVIATE